MRNRMLYILIALLLGACSTPKIEAVVSTPTAFQQEPNVAVGVDNDENPENTPQSTESTPEVRDATGIPDPGTATWVLVAGDFRRPVAVTHAGDERLFVVEQEGVIWILENGQRLSEPFLDIRQLVNDRSNEQGLLGIAFHPQYGQNGYFFINYTGTDGETRISRFSSSPDPNRADVDSETILLTIVQPYGNHNGGSIVFGPDGYLYIGTGDGGSAGDPLGNGQRLDTLLGKILRLDIDSTQPYAIPPSNPYAQGGGLPEIWSFGLRNPWRIAFDKGSGDLFIADVGQNQWEEINHQTAHSIGGENYGWNLREGAHPYAGGQASWIDPVAEYDHGVGCSVTGGEVIRDPRLPAWSGVYLYGDYCTGRVWGLLSKDQGWLNQLLFEATFRLSSFGQDSIGRIYLVDHQGGIYRLDPTA
jgi:glucose/arabinose dehydrogenase